MTNYIYWAEDSSEALEHHGILGMKWGIRRYQNEDGSLTPEGRERYGGPEHRYDSEVIDEIDRRNNIIGYARRKTVKETGNSKYKSKLPEYVDDLDDVAYKKYEKAYDEASKKFEIAKRAALGVGAAATIAGAVAMFAPEIMFALAVSTGTIISADAIMAAGGISFAALGLTSATLATKANSIGNKVLYNDTPDNYDDLQRAAVFNSIIAKLKKDVG